MPRLDRQTTDVAPSALASSTVTATEANQEVVMAHTESDGSRAAAVPLKVLPMHREGLRAEARASAWAH